MIKPEKIGITGPQASGKDTASEHLQVAHGYLHFSTSDIIRDETIRLHGSEDQYLQQQVAKQLRASLGANALCLMAFERYEQEGADYDGLVVSGYRNRDAAQSVRDQGGLLVFTDAPLEVRFARLLGRGRIGESTTFEEFRTIDEQERRDSLKLGQNLDAIRAMSDLYVCNDGSKETFLTAIDQLATSGTLEAA